MYRLLAAVCVPSTLAILLTAPAAAQTSVPAAADPCDKHIEITGGQVAIRDQPNPSAPIVRSVKRGDVLTSCLIFIGRGTPYDKCGSEHYDWYLVNVGTPKSGYVPVTCARVL
jgi:hypothetical protein